MSVILSGPTPDPGLGSPVELSGGDVGGLLNLIRVCEALPGERIAAEEAPPALLGIEPPRSRRDKDVRQAWMSLQPGTGLPAVVAREIVTGDDSLWLKPRASQART